MYDIIFCYKGIIDKYKANINFILHKDLYLKHNCTILKIL